MKGREWLWVVLLAGGFAAAWWAGVPAGTLLIAAALLVCPLAMYFGMSSMAHERTGAGGLEQGRSERGLTPGSSPDEQAPVTGAPERTPRRG